MSRGAQRCALALLAVCWPRWLGRLRQPAVRCSTATDAAAGRPPPPPRPTGAGYDARGRGARRRCARCCSNYLDLARFQTRRRASAITDAELDRLAAAAPAQARALLETEGYFDAEVDGARRRQRRRPAARRVDVVPGPRTTVAQRRDRGRPRRSRRAGRRASDAAARPLEQLRATWPLRPGEPFRNAAWSGAKNAALARLRADGYPRADLAATQARVDAREPRAALVGHGRQRPAVPPRRDRASKGSQRYDEARAQPRADFAPGERPTARSAARLPGAAAASSACSKARRSSSTPTGAARRRAGDRQVQGADAAAGHRRRRLQRQHRPARRRSSTSPQPRSAGTWIAHNKLELGPRPASRSDRAHRLPARATSTATCSPAPSSSCERRRDAHSSADVRVGRTQGHDRFDRLYFVEVVARHGARARR